MNHNTCTTSVTSNQSISRADLRHYQAAMTGRRQIWNLLRRPIYNTKSVDKANSVSLPHQRLTSKRNEPTLFMLATVRYFVRRLR